MLESEMQKAENDARKRHGKRGKNAEKFINSERLRVLGRYLGEEVKRFREPGPAPNTASTEKKQDAEQVLGDSFFKLKGQ